jgi:putative transcriptional regulator
VSSLAPGLLVAMPQLLDPNFHRAVVLLVHHDEEGTFGVVLNRTTEITADRLCSSIDIDWYGDPTAEIHWGGPVQPQTGWVLFDERGGSGAVGDAHTLCDGLTFAGSLDVLRDVASQPPERLRVMLGYAGWAPGQLESELAEGAWLVAPLDENAGFDVDPDALWSHVVRSLGIEPATLVAGRGIH